MLLCMARTQTAIPDSTTPYVREFQVELPVDLGEAGLQASYMPWAGVLLD